MKKCFGYVRVSTHKQGEGVSLEAQKEAILRFCDSNQIEIIRWFEEQETAAKQGRPIFNEMTKALRRGQAAGLVIHKIDRSARNFKDWALIGDLADAGIDVHFATESLDFRSRGGRLAADIQAVIAADYIRNLREEVVKGQTGLLKRGHYPFKAPIGYLDSGKGQLKSIDPIKGPLVKRAFELYAGGRYSIRALQTEMRKHGLQTASGKPLSKGCIEKMLANPFYIGVIRIRRTGATYAGAHEPLITANTFSTVQVIKEGRYAKKVTRHNHTYRGLFQCRQCGLSMIPERQQGHVYYRCQTQDCPSNSIREELIEEAVAQILDQATLSDAMIQVIVDTVEQWRAKNTEAAGVRSYELQLDQLNGRLERLTDALVDQVIDRETFNQRKERLLIEQLTLEQRLKELHQKAISPTMLRSFLERLKSLREHYIFANPEEKREIVQTALSNRSVWDKKVYLEPSNWLRDTQNALSVFYCAQERT